MRKKLIILMSIVVIVISICLLLNNYNIDHVIVMDEKKTTKSSSSISMMLETSAGSGMYEVSEDTSWPTSCYTFNEKLSKCVNGSTLSYDSDSNTVYFSGTSKDYCYVYFDVEYVTLAGAVTYNTCGGDGVNSLYYFDGAGGYTNYTYEAVDYSYRYVEGDYALTDAATNAGYSTITNTSSSGTTGFVYFYCNGSKSYVGNTCSSSYTYYYTLAYESEATQYSTYQEALDQAVSDGYLTEDNVKNYVCFGSDTDPCPDTNLYRIIGWFKNGSGDYEMKIIKADYASSDLLGTDGDWYSSAYTSYYYSGDRNTTTASSQARYYWNDVNYSSSYRATGYYNDWSYSQLNTVNLNTNYWGTLDTDWQDMVSEHTWIVGGGSTSFLYTSVVKNAYAYEIANPNTSQVDSTYTSNVGLLYVSDYGYAALPTYWTTGLSSYSSAKDSNWLYNGAEEWTISRASSSTNTAFYIRHSGIDSYANVGPNGFAVRPVLYLESSTTITGGSGTSSDPYKIT